MSDSNHNKNCVFSEQAISYLYGEISPGEKTIFERHLKTCPPCADDINGFALSRSAVAYWKSEEFELLNTPKFELTVNDKPVRLQTRRAENQSWTVKLKSIFTFSPVWTAALVLFVFFGGLVLFVQNSVRDDLIVENSNKKAAQTKNIPKQIDEEKAVAKNSVSEPIQNSDSKVISNDKSTAVDSAPKDKDFAKENVSAANKIFTTTNKSAEPAAYRKIKSAAQNKSDAANPAVSRRLLNTSNNKKRMPQLNGVEDEEEAATLRLTDLLDEVGGK